MQMPGAIGGAMGGMMSPNGILGLTLMKYFDFGDNVAMQYVFNIALMALIPMLTSTMPMFIGAQFVALYYFARRNLFPRPLQSTLELTAVQEGPMLTASKETAAWLWYIRTHIVPQHSKKTMEELNFFQRQYQSWSRWLRNEKEFVTDLTQKMSERKNVVFGGSNEEPDPTWWPVAGYYFQIENKITGLIDASAQKKEEAAQRNSQPESSGGNTIRPAQRSVEIKLILFCPRTLGLDHLIQTTNKIRKMHAVHIQDQLTKGSQIFYWDEEQFKREEKYQRDNFWRSFDSAPNGWNNVKFSATRRMEHLWFKQKDVFMQAYTRFLDHKEEYEERGDPYTFSALLYGVPGCGKTSLIKAVINMDQDRGINSHIFAIPIADIDGVAKLRMLMFEEEVGDFKIPLDRRIYIFEDFDAFKGAKLFHKREMLEKKEKEKKEKEKNKASDAIVGILGAATGVDFGSLGDDTKKQKEQSDLKLTLSDILNVLDGVNERTGMRCFWTTNVSPPSEYFDPAFLRPGRMDMIIELTKCDHRGLAYLIGHFFKKDISIAEVRDVDEYIVTPAELKQICKQSKNADAVLDELEKMSKATEPVAATPGVAIDGPAPLKRTPSIVPSGHLVGEKVVPNMEEDKNKEEEEIKSKKALFDECKQKFQEDYSEKFMEHGWPDPEDWHVITDEQLAAMDFKSGHIYYFNKYFREAPPESAASDDVKVPAEKEEDESAGSPDAGIIPSVGALQADIATPKMSMGGDHIVTTPKPQVDDKQAEEEVEAN